MELENQELTINFLKILKMCIRIPGANRSVLSFPVPPMKPVSITGNQLDPPKNFLKILKFVSGYQEQTGVYFPFLSRQWNQYYSKPIGALKSGVYHRISQKILICIRIPGATRSVLFFPPIEFSSTFCEQKFCLSQEIVK